jgi:hypothetical protein
MQLWWLIDIQYYQYLPNMFRVPLHPSSGGQIVLACCCQWCCVLVLAVMVPARRVARCVHCYEDVAVRQRPRNSEPEHNNIGGKTQPDLLS